MQILEKPRDPPLETVLVDTAGQIEIFTWSASGTIITDVLASSLPTVIVYVVDTTRCMNPQTFMSNMMQACSILYKTRLPLVLVRSPLFQQPLVNFLSSSARANTVCSCIDCWLAMAAASSRGHCSARLHPGIFPCMVSSG